MKIVLVAGCAAFLFCASALAQSPAAQAPNPLVALGRQVLVEWTTPVKDQFAPPPSKHIDQIGTPFTIVLKGEEVSGFSARYYNGVLSMKLEHTAFYYNERSLDLSLADSVASVEAIWVDHRENPSSTAVGQNGYGATTTIVRRSRDSFYVAAVQMPRGDSGQVKDAQYTWEKTLDGPEAKAIFVGSKAIIEGEIAALPSGKVARCEAFTKDATFSSPVAIHNYDCYVGAKITRIAFISGDGSVIKEWK